MLRCSSKRRKVHSPPSLGPCRVAPVRSRPGRRRCADALMGTSCRVKGQRTLMKDGSCANSGRIPSNNKSPSTRFTTLCHTYRMENSRSRHERSKVGSVTSVSKLVFVVITKKESETGVRMTHEKVFITKSSFRFKSVQIFAYLPSA